MDLNPTQRKIIHIDMDAFYASVEARDNPAFKLKPFAVGGPENHRGVIYTSNYIARSYGVYSAMPTIRAKMLCPDLIVIPPNFDKYRTFAHSIHAIFESYTEQIEPISLDEAYLDVSTCHKYQNSATRIAKAIMHEIKEKYQLSASAGIAPNKLLAKIASDWQKPNGLFTIAPSDIQDFIKTLPIQKLPGVGPITANKLFHLGIFNCNALQQVPLPFLLERFGKMGNTLHHYAKGIDTREVISHRERKSLSVESTFSHDLVDRTLLETKVQELVNTLLMRLKKRSPKNIIKTFVKVKFSNFVTSTSEHHQTNPSFEDFLILIKKNLNTTPNIPIRLLGVGVRFQDTNPLLSKQLPLFAYF